MLLIFRIVWFLFCRDIHGPNAKIDDPVKMPTPYGGRLIWSLPGGNKLIAHLKDKSKVKIKKRWRQVRSVTQGIQSFSVPIVLFPSRICQCYKKLGENKKLLPTIYELRARSTCFLHVGYVHVLFPDTSTSGRRKTEQKTEAKEGREYVSDGFGWRCGF